MSGPRVAFTLEQCWHEVPGGTAVAALGAATALLRRDDVDLIGVAAAHREDPSDPWVPPLDVAHLPLPRLLLYEAWHRLRAPKVQRATGPVDVIHATTIAIPPHSAPLVVTVHDLAFIREPGHFTPRGVGFFKRGLELVERDADVVICPSEATRKDCTAYGLEAAKLEVVPLGVTSEMASPDDVARVRKAYNLPDRYVLWTGTIEPRKNLGTLLAAFSELDSEADLVLAGPEGWNQNLEELVRRHRLETRVKRLGFVPQGDLAGIYAAARVFCFPSLTEGFGFPVLEAMMQGTPVITSAGTSTEEVGGDAAVLVEPRDTAAITGALTQILEDPALASKLSAAGLERARTFNWDRTAEGLARIYRELVA